MRVVMRKLMRLEGKAGAGLHIGQSLVSHFEEFAFYS